jgi:DNA polymerase-3 subunit delta'
MLDKASSAEGERRTKALPEGLDDDVLAAIEAEVSVGLRTGCSPGSRSRRGPTRASSPRPGRRRAAASSRPRLTAWSGSAGLLRANLNESAALEDFLLASLRIWARR